MRPKSTDTVKDVRTQSTVKDVRTQSAVKDVRTQSRVVNPDDRVSNIKREKATISATDLVADSSAINGGSGESTKQRKKRNDKTRNSELKEAKSVLPSETQPLSNVVDASHSQTIKLDLDEDIFGGIDSILDLVSETNSSATPECGSTTDSECPIFDLPPLIPDWVKPSLSSFRFAKGSVCPMCAKSGISSKLTFRFVSFEVSVRGAVARR